MNITPYQDRSAWLFFTGPALCCAAAAALTGLMTASAEFHLLALMTVAACLALQPLWLRAPLRLRGLPSLLGVLGSFCLAYGTLLPAAVQEVAPLVILPARPAVLAAGVCLILAAGISALARSPAGR